MKRQTIPTTYGGPLARWVAALDREGTGHLGVVEGGELRPFIDPHRTLADPLVVRTDRAFGEAERLVVDTFECADLGDLWRRHGGNVSAMAPAAQMDRKHLAVLLDKHDLWS